ncbi:beta-1,6-N-acetylglucosaminyltransferase [Hufsiella ginkgonis]|uniref:Peptide O-xylosyltransferase n=1 Tax=Hufsiella ginkgonis TaxID=2695274 RepID=A0A7K1XSP2_9SPHI|nr:beta-1,6-N-acetylglucosaminyltransferase [Hufsiella ginkgonis]MXV13898.1 hypothetical protein [Hufsiella ginkgonis]
MTITYVIRADRDPAHLVRLINMLNDGGTKFVVHVDKRASLAAFKNAFIKEKWNDIHFIRNRCTAGRGSFGVVEATLNALRFVKNKFKEAEHIVVINGHDYPVKPAEDIANHFRRNPGKTFLEHFNVPDGRLYEGGVDRFPGYEETKRVMTLRIGSECMSFPLQVVKMIFAFLKINPDFITYFRQVNFPIESFFQTLLMNCGAEEIRSQLINTRMHVGKTELKNIAEVDVNSLRSLNSTGYLFSGPFESLADNELLDRVDNQLLKALPAGNTVNKVRLVNDKTLPARAGGTAVLMLTNKKDALIAARFDSLKQHADRDQQFFLLRHTDAENGFGGNNTGTVEFTDSILYDLGYIPICNRLIPGSNHFPILKFYLHHPGFDYYWYVEEDVYYNGEWCDFFRFFSSQGIETDFLASHVTDRVDIPAWYWWNTLRHPDGKQRSLDKMRSFNPIFRISNAALAFIHKMLMEGWSGHHEVLIPTLLNNGGFLIHDIGGTGKYVLPGCAGKFYTSAAPDPFGELRTGSLRFRPVITHEEIGERVLYHPVKWSDN